MALLAIFIRKVVFTIVAIAALVGTSTARAAEMPVSREEFETLARDLAPKVNLFRDVWKVDAEAEFFGGTSRDYLYWLKGKLKAARNRAEAETIMRELRAREIIDVRDFILFESDVDVVSKTALGVNAARYGVKKIDAIPASRFDPSTPEGQTELKQGYIPAEKIRLGLKGLVAPGPFGDGVGEIFESKITVRFASDTDFASTLYAQQKLNHPILLAVRFIRILAMDHFQNHGKALPKAENLLRGIDPESERAVRAVIERTLTSGELRDYLAQPKFAAWLNLGIQKAYRSYTNPTAAKMLMEHFRADQLPVIYSGLEPTNQYLFVKRRDEALVRRNLAKFEVDPSRFYSAPKSFFDDGHIYHGTRTEAAFRSILFQGILPSQGGLAGEGLYGVASRNKKFSEEWGGAKERLVKLRLSPEAKVVDISTGYGREIFLRAKMTESDFAEAFGVDILRYPYGTEAFVVKNAAVLLEVDGVYRSLMRFDDMLALIRTRRVTLAKLLQMISDNALNETEVRALLKEPRLVPVLNEIAAKSLEELVKTKSVAAVLKDGVVDLFVLPGIEQKVAAFFEPLSLDRLAVKEPWLEDFMRLNSQHRTMIEAVRARVAVAKATRALARAPQRTGLRDWASDPTFLALRELNVDVFRVPTFADALAQDMNSLSLKEIESPPDWMRTLIANLIHDPTFQRLRDERMSTEAKGMTVLQLERAMADAHVANRPLLWTVWKKELSERKGIPILSSSGTSTNSTDPFERYFYANQKMLWEPHLLSPAGYRYYFMKLVGHIMAKPEKNERGLPVAKYRISASLLPFLLRTMESLPGIEESVEFKKLIAEVEKTGGTGLLLQFSIKRSHWGLVDDAIERALYEIGNGRAEKEFVARFGKPDLGNWLVHAFKTGKTKVRPEALIGAKLAIGPIASIYLGSNHYMEYIGWVDALISFPQLRRHARGVQIMEEVIGEGLLHENSKYAPDFRKHLEEAVNGLWADHPRAEVWRKALQIERNRPGQITAYGAMIEDKATPRADFLKTQPMSRSVTCEMYFRRTVNPQRPWDDRL